MKCRYPDAEDDAEALRIACNDYALRPKRKASAPSTVTKSSTEKKASSDWEARIMMMKWPELKETLDRNKIQIIEEAPNPGIRTMRGRNALYAALRRGVVLR